MADPLRIEVTASANGRKGSVRVNGEDISRHVRGYRLRSHVDTGTTMLLELTNIEVTTVEASSEDR